MSSKIIKVPVTISTTLIISVKASSMTEARRVAEESKPLVTVKGVEAEVTIKAGTNAEIKELNPDKSL